MRSNIVLAILSFLVFFRCSFDKNTELNTCKEFWLLNKDSSFGELTNVFIEARSTEFDSKKGMYVVSFYYYSVYDSLLKEYVKFPLYERNASSEEIQKAYSGCDKKCKEMLEDKFKVHGDSDLVRAYNDFTNKIIDCYDKIRLPEGYQFSNVLLLQGRPNYGLITFKLASNMHIYFIRNIKSLNTKYLREFIKDKNKFDEHWYYKIDPD